MKEVLDTVTACIEEYEQSNIKHLDSLNELLQVLTSNLFYLASERAKYHDHFQKRVYHFTTEKKLSVNKAENQAHVEVPELYQLRYILKYADAVVMSIQQNISTMKTERRNT